MPDPYELKTVKLVNSTASPNSGEGVIAIRDIPKGRIAAMYSLFLYTKPEQTDLYSMACTFNKSKSDDYRRHCKKYSLSVNIIDAKIDLPPEFDVHPLPNLGTNSIMETTYEGCNFIGKGGERKKIDLPHYPFL